LITQQEFNSIRPGDFIELGARTRYTIDTVDVKYGKYMITQMFYLYYGKPKYTNDAPYNYNALKDIITKIIKGKISNWRKVIEDGKRV